MKYILSILLFFAFSCQAQIKYRVIPGAAYPPTSGALTYDTIEVFNQTFDAALSGDFNSVRNTTTDFTISGGKITFPASNGSAYQYTKQIVYNVGTLNENCYQKATIIRNSNDFAYGVGIGWRSINTRDFNWSVYGYLNQNTYSANKGKCVTVSPLFGDFFSTSAMSLPAIGDTIDLTIQRIGINYTVTAYNRNNGQSNSYEFVTYPTATPYVAHQISVPVLNWFGGGFSVLNWSYHIIKPRTVETMIIGNSITYGQAASTQAQRYASLIVNPEYNIISGGGSDVTQSVLDRMEEIKLLHPKRVLLMIGGNDVYFGIPAATYRANLIAIRDSLVNNGIECIHMLPTARTIVDERPLKNFLDTCSRFATDKKIDLFTLTLKSGTSYSLEDSYNSGDGVHPSNAGHTAIADYINARLREWGYDVIQGNQLRKIKIIVKNKPR